jgi:hypothetical protein
MKHFKILMLFLLLVSFSQVELPDVYKNSWKLEQIDYPNKSSINEFESVWFLTLEGKTGTFNNNDNEISMNGTWTKKDKNLVIKENKEITKYQIISWTSQQIILSDDEANYYFKK